MADDKYKEVAVVLVACIILFLILAAIILLFLYLYQRRKFLQQQEMTELQQQFERQSLKAQLEIQEQTFQAVSQEIHDNVGQILSLAKVQINIMTESEKMDRDMLLQVKENVGKAMTDLRDLSKSMNSERIRTGALHETMLYEAECINRTGVIRAEVLVEGAVQEMDAQKKLIVFRIIQESIQNCIKHAEATTIRIAFQYEATRIMIRITDDGKGFDPEEALKSRSGSGLANINTRAALTGGSCRIESQPNGGTKLFLNIPYG